MSHENMNDGKVSFVSTFLSHSSVDKPLVEAVAQQLVRRGVLTWFDKNELRELGPLDATLKQAVQAQATLTIFLSEASINSSWCQDELQWALEAQEGLDHILLISLGDPLPLVQAHPLLSSRFLHADGDRVNPLGHVCQSVPTESDITAVADKIAATAYQRTLPKKWSEIVVYVDQRGNGPRRGTPDLPENIARLEAPVLLFRPDLGDKEPRSFLRGAEWEHVVNTMTRSLSNALGTIRAEPRRVRVSGWAQTGLLWAIGRHFDRTTSAVLYGYGTKGRAITNKDQERLMPLPGGNADVAQQVSGPPIQEGMACATVALAVGSQENYEFDVCAAVPDLPLFWIDPRHIQDSAAAMSLAKDLVATVKGFRKAYKVAEVILFWTTANNVALLAAANLTASHGMPPIKYMEWDHAASEYVHLPMPGDTQAL